MGRSITEEIITRFQNCLREEEKSAATVRKYIHDVKRFTEFTGKTEIERQTVLAFKQRLIDSGYAVRSINSMIASLNSLFAHLGWHDLKVKSIRLQRQVFCPEDRELTMAEYQRLCRTAQKRHNKRLDLILQTICGTGIRVSELRFITVESLKRGEAAVNGKGKIRHIFIVRKLQKKLLRYVAEQGIKAGSVFITRTGKPMNRTSIWREMKALCGEANVNPTKVFPHNLRHLFARVFYGVAKDIAKLADLLGHSNIDTTRIYIVSTGAEHRKYMEDMKLVI